MQKICRSGGLVPVRNFKVQDEDTSVVTSWEHATLPLARPQDATSHDDVLCSLPAITTHTHHKSKLLLLFLFHQSLHR